MIPSCAKVGDLSVHCWNKSAVIEQRQILKRFFSIGTLKNKNYIGF
jgi:hypothetical protein